MLNVIPFDAIRDDFNEYNYITAKNVYFLEILKAMKSFNDHTILNFVTLFDYKVTY
jgi:hypothetical protein